MFVVFDLDGTLAVIDHRMHHLEGPKKDYDAFFKACVDDLVNDPVVESFFAHLSYGHKVEIWSGRSDIVRKETEDWLERQCGIDPCFLARMRQDGDYTPDVELKRNWLLELHESERPNIVYDDRKRLVDMWRAEGVACFQVASGDFDEKKIKPIAQPMMYLMVGPSGGGKTRFAEQYANENDAVLLSSDNFRAIYCGNFRDQSRNNDVFSAMKRIARVYIDSGVPVIIDATNLHRKDRLAFVNIVPNEYQVMYVVCDRPMEAKVEDGDWRNDIIHEKSGLPLMQLHQQRFNAQLDSILRGDDVPNVTVLDRREDTV